MAPPRKSKRLFKKTSRDQLKETLSLPEKAESAGDISLVKAEQTMTVPLKDEVTDSKEAKSVTVEQSMKEETEKKSPQIQGEYDSLSLLPSEQELKTEVSITSGLVAPQISPSVFYEKLLENEKEPEECKVSITQVILKPPAFGEGNQSILPDGKPKAEEVNVIPPRKKSKSPDSTVTPVPVSETGRTPCVDKEAEKSVTTEFVEKEVLLPKRKSHMVTMTVEAVVEETRVIPPRKKSKTPESLSATEEISEQLEIAEAFRVAHTFDKASFAEVTVKEIESCEENTEVLQEETVKSPKTSEISPDVEENKILLPRKKSKSPDLSTEQVIATQEPPSVIISTEESVTPDNVFRPPEGTVLEYIEILPPKRKSKSPKLSSKQAGHQDQSIQGEPERQLTDESESKSDKPTSTLHHVLSSTESVGSEKREEELDKPMCSSTPQAVTDSTETTAKVLPKMRKAKSLDVYTVTEQRSESDKTVDIETKEEKEPENDPSRINVVEEQAEAAIQEKNKVSPPRRKSKKSKILPILADTVEHRAVEQLEEQGALPTDEQIKVTRTIPTEEKSKGFETSTGLDDVTEVKSLNLDLERGKTLPISRKSKDTKVSPELPHKEEVDVLEKVESQTETAVIEKSKVVSRTEKSKKGADNQTPSATQQSAPEPTDEHLEDVEGNIKEEKLLENTETSQTQDMIATATERPISDIIRGANIEPEGEKTIETTDVKESKTMPSKRKPKSPKVSPVLPYKEESHTKQDQDNQTSNAAVVVEGNVKPSRRRSKKGSGSPKPSSMQEVAPGTSETIRSERGKLSTTKRKPKSMKVSPDMMRTERGPESQRASSDSEKVALDIILIEKGKLALTVPTEPDNVDRMQAKEVDDPHKLSLLSTAEDKAGVIEKTSMSYNIAVCGDPEMISSSDRPEDFEKVSERVNSVINIEDVKEKAEILEDLEISIVSKTPSDAKEAEEEPECVWCAEVAPDKSETAVIQGNTAQEILLVTETKPSVMDVVEPSSPQSEEIDGNFETASYNLMPEYEMSVQVEDNILKVPEQKITTIILATTEASVESVEPTSIAVSRVDLTESQKQDIPEKSLEHPASVSIEPQVVLQESEVEKSNVLAVISKAKICDIPETVDILERAANVDVTDCKEDLHPNKPEGHMDKTGVKEIEIVGEPDQVKDLAEFIVPKEEIQTLITNIIPEGEIVDVHVEETEQVYTVIVNKPESIEQLVETVTLPLTVSLPVSAFSESHETKNVSEKVLEQPITLSKDSQTTELPLYSKPTDAPHGVDYINNLWSDTTEVQKRYVVLDMPGIATSKTYEIKVQHSKDEETERITSKQKIIEPSESTSHVRIVDTTEERGKPDMECDSDQAITAVTGAEIYPAEQDTVKLSPTVIHLEVLKSKQEGEQTESSSSAAKDLLATPDEKGIKIHMGPGLAILRLDLENISAMEPKFNIVETSLQREPGEPEDKSSPNVRSAGEMSQIKVQVSRTEQPYIDVISDMNKPSQSSEEKSVTIEKIQVGPEVRILQLDIETTTEEPRVKIQTCKKDKEIQEASIVSDIEAQGMTVGTAELQESEPERPKNEDSAEHIESSQLCDIEKEFIEISLFEEDALKPRQGDVMTLKSTEDTTAEVKEVKVEEEPFEVSAQSALDLAENKNEKMEIINLEHEVNDLYLDVPVTIEEQKNGFVLLTKTQQKEEENVVEVDSTEPSSTDVAVLPYEAETSTVISSTEQHIKTYLDKIPDEVVEVSAKDIHDSLQKCISEPKQSSVEEQTGITSENVLQDKGKTTGKTSVEMTVVNVTTENNDVDVLDNKSTMAVDQSFPEYKQLDKMYVVLEEMRFSNKMSTDEMEQMPQSDSILASSIGPTSFSQITITKADTDLRHSQNTKDDVPDAPQSPVEKVASMENILKGEEELKKEEDGFRIENLTENKELTTPKASVELKQVITEKEGGKAQHDSSQTSSETDHVKLSQEEKLTNVTSENKKSEDLVQKRPAATIKNKPVLESGIQFETVTETFEVITMDIQPDNFTEEEKTDEQTDFMAGPSFADKPTINGTEKEKGGKDKEREEEPKGQIQERETAAPTGEDNLEVFDSSKVRCDLKAQVYFFTFWCIHIIYSLIWQEIDQCK